MTIEHRRNAIAIIATNLVEMVKHNEEVAKRIKPCAEAIGFTLDTPDLDALHVESAAVMEFLRDRAKRLAALIDEGEG